MMFTLKSFFPFPFVSRRFSSSLRDILCAEKTWSCGSVLFKIRSTTRKWANCTPKKRARSWTSRSRPTVFAKCRTNWAWLSARAKEFPISSNWTRLFRGFHQRTFPFRRFDGPGQKIGSGQELAPEEVGGLHLQGQGFGRTPVLELPWFFTTGRICSRNWRWIQRNWKLGPAWPR